MDGVVAYSPGDVVDVEGVVVGYEAGFPHGVVIVNFPVSSDPDRQLDGVTIIVPEQLVTAYNENKESQ